MSCGHCRKNVLFRLVQCISSAGQLMQDPKLAAAAARVGAWKSLCARLRSAASAKLPDLQTLMAVHGELPKSQGVQQVLSPPHLYMNPAHLLSAPLEKMEHGALPS